MLLPFFGMGLLSLRWGANSAATMLPSRRHVVLITVDALRADYLSANGYDLPTSPVMDSLLRNGTSFTHAVTTIARTTPALASLLTGTYPQNNGVRDLVDKLDPQIASLPELARARGYATVAVVSNPILSGYRGLDRGFDVYDVAEDARDAAKTTAVALRRIQGLVPDDAVFLWVHYIDPHVPYYPPPELAAQFDSGYKGPYQLHFGEFDGGLGDYPQELPKETVVYRNPLPERVNEHIRRLYAADIRQADNGIGELLQGLRRALGNDWVVVLAADHGESLGEHGYFFEHGDYVSEPELHVPLAFTFGPGDPLQSRRTASDWVSLVDVAPTLVELLDLHPSQIVRQRFDGRSLGPALRGALLPERPVFAESGEAFFPSLVRRRKDMTVDGRLRTAILQGHKLVWTPGLEPSTAYELYDLADDPAETRDLFRTVVSDGESQRLRALLDQWYAQGRTVAAPRVQLTKTDRERLRVLGYTN